MKIGILTFHDGYNYGGFFQAYALRETLEIEGHDVSILHYKNYKHWFYELLVHLNPLRPGNVPGNIRKIRAFQKAQKPYFSGLPSFTIARLNPLQFDAIVVGSDIVWNYEWWYLGHDPVYFGNGFDKKRLVAYAPSIGDASLEDPLPDYVQEGVKKFAHIAVRDERTASMVETVLGVRPKIVLDPTLLLDFRGREKLCPVKQDFILAYCLPLSDKEVADLKTFARERNLSILSIGHAYPWAHVNIPQVGPFEWLGYFAKAKYVVTSTFHGTLFSILYRKKFVFLPNTRTTPKLAAILQRTGLDVRMLKNGCALVDIVESEINYETVYERIDEMREDSMDYLRRAIHGSSDS